MIQDDKVLLIRHTYLEGWFMPGGGLNRNENLEQAARREAREETGAILKDVSFVGIFTNYVQWKTDHTTVFLCKDFEIVGKPDAEIAEARFFHLDSLPENFYASHLRLLKMYQAGKMPQIGEW